MPNREIIVFPYTCQLPVEHSNAETLHSHFLRNNMEQNTVPYGDNFLLLISDRQEGDFLYGRFLKLRRDKPGIINLRRRTEGDIQLDDGDNIKEQSHFVWNITDGIIFGEYNYHSVRHFSFPLRTYLSENLHFPDRNAQIRPIPDPSTFTRMRSDPELKKITVSIAQQSLTDRERDGVSLLGGLLGLSSNDQATLEITVGKGRWRDTHLVKERVISTVQLLRERGDDLYSLRVEGVNSAYDILNDNLTWYKCNVATTSRKVVSSSFYTNAREKYDENIAAILRNIRRT